MRAFLKNSNKIDDVGDDDDDDDDDLNQEFTRQRPLHYR